MSAGKIDTEWLEMARMNAEGSDSSVEDLICIVKGKGFAEIDGEGSVFVGEESGLGGYNGWWLSQEDIDALCALIDGGI